MTTEEKARAYDEILAKAKEFKFQGYIDEECLYDMFPHLRESEDERTRKWIMDVFKAAVSGGTGMEVSVMDAEKAIAWLEKQGQTKESGEVPVHDRKMARAIWIYLDWLDGRKACAPRGDYTIREMIDWLLSHYPEAKTGAREIADERSYAEKTADGYSPF